MGPVNPLSIPQWLLDEWAATDQPIQERGNVLPLGTYEDGSVHFAWPEMSGVPAFNRMAERGPQWDASSPEGQAHALDALSVGGSLALGGIGASAAKTLPSRALGPDRALGYAEKNYVPGPIKVYHGTQSPEDFTKFHTDPFFTTDTMVTDSFAQRGRNDYADGARVIPAMIDPRNPFFMPDFGADANAHWRALGQDPWTAKTTFNELARSKGHDFIVHPPSHPMASAVEYEAIAPNTVRSATTGETLFSNPKEAAAVQAGVSLANDTPKGITAYHGSPYDFDRFSLDKIGSGEGAQAYGHGLYFAENEGVARSYRDNLAGLDTSYIAENEPRLRDFARDVDARIAAGDNPRYATSQARTRLAQDPYFRDNPSELAKLIDRIDGVVPRTGRMYEVNIKANPEDFLDWDKPLSGQSDKVKALYNSYIAPRLNTRPVGSELTDVNIDRGAIGAYPHDEVPSVLANPADYVPTRGGDFYDEFARQQVNGDWGAPGDFARTQATQALREAGIPGIKYLDGNSRGAGEGSSNYVVFDDALIEILKKYSNPPTASLPSLATGGEENDAFLDALLARYGVN